MDAVPDQRRIVLEGEELTILNGLRFALAINSGIFIFIRAMPDGLRAVRLDDVRHGDHTEELAAAAEHNDEGVVQQLAKMIPTFTPTRQNLKL